MTEGDGQPQRSSYDELPYGASAHASTWIGRLAAVATLFGGTPPPVDACRVLELGCARGSNLVPMAVALPRSSFVGVDLSAVQIADGERTVAALGLENIELRHASILDVDEAYGSFDYVICHGVFAWVPSDVQQQILRICSRNLSPHGIAVVSYNTFPGWHFRGLVRDMLLYHSNRFGDPSSRVAASRALLRFLAQSAGTSGPYGDILNDELRLLSSLPDYYVFHEHLEADNRPLYFHQFADMLTPFDLQYLGEADVRTMSHLQFPDDVQRVLQQLAGDVIQAEQYMDFLRNRMFRQTLLCHRDVRLTRSLTPDVMTRFRVSSAATEVNAAAGVDDVEFRVGDDLRLKTADPLLVAAVRLLAQASPAALPHAELARQVAHRIGVDVAKVEPRLAVRLLRLYLTSRLIELVVGPQTFTLRPDDRPLASPLARLQAVASAWVTNLKHESVRLTDAERAVLVRLDGTRTQADVFEELQEPTSPGLEGGVLPRADAAESARIADAVPRILGDLARAALLLR